MHKYCLYFSSLALACGIVSHTDLNGCNWSIIGKLPQLLGCSLEAIESGLDHAICVFVFFVL